MVVRKEEGSQRHKLSFHLNNLKKIKEQNKLKVSGRKKIINMRVTINKIKKKNQ